MALQSTRPPGALGARVIAWAEGPPADLAVFRIVVGLVLLRLPALSTAPRWAALSDAVRTPPVGLDWAIGTIPMTTEYAVAAYWVVVIATCTGILGILSRTSWAVVAIVGLYLLGIPQFAGSAFHYHHLIWFAALLAVSPCGDALSVDALIRRRRGRAVPNLPTLAHGIPLRIVWLLIGVIFFFPGLWKLLESGPDWIFSDNLRNQMYAKWFQMPWLTPPFRIDHYPTLLRTGALAVVALELSFFALVIHRKTRAVAVVGALVFHQLTAYFMGLRFPALWLTYAAFVPWTAFYRFVRRKIGREVELPEGGDASNERAGHRLAPMLTLGAILLVGNLTFGALGISDGWPFACYPKFHRTVAARLPVLEVQLVYADGVRTVPLEWMSPEGLTQRWWALSWSLMGSHERARADERRFRAFFDRTASRGAFHDAAQTAIAVRFYRNYVSTVPEESDDPPLRRQLLAELPLP